MAQAVIPRQPLALAPEIYYTYPMQSLRRHLPLLASFILGALIFGFIGWYLPSPSEGKKFTGGVLFQANDPYQFIDPLLACDIGTQNTFTDLDPLHQSVEKVLQTHLQNGDASSVSVYFRALHSAHWFDSNPDTTYAPASLLKTFVMMAYFEEARENQTANVLGRKMVFHASGTSTKDETGMQVPHLVDGQSYSAQDLIDQMIIYSDNDALNTLVQNGDDKMIQLSNQIFSDLRIASPLTPGAQLADFMTVDQYSMVFRVLYSSTYLGRKYSDQALSLLSKAAYKNGIVAGVPNGTVVAHKYGYSVGQSTEHTTPLELHDCGVVYYPGNPYLLCVMTKGTTLDGLQSTIRDISSVTWAGMGKLK